MGIIETDQLTYRYGSRRGIDAVGLRVHEGALYGFLGPNGAGKTTTIRVLLGFLHGSTGMARVFGLDCWTQSARIKQDLGYVPGDLRLWPWLTGQSALNMVGAIRGRELATPGRQLADMFELDLSVKVRRMSKGMRQKLGLILAMAHDPKLLILDEPSSGLDPLMQDRLLEYLRTVARRGRTVFFSSHTLSEVERLCDRLAIIRQGRIVFDGPLDDLRRQAGHEVRLRWNPAREIPADFDRSIPAGVRLVSRDGLDVHLHSSVEVVTLLPWLGTLPIDDLALGRPDLESIFRAFYQTDAQSAENGGRR